MLLVCCSLSCFLYELVHVPGFLDQDAGVEQESMTKISVVFCYG
jgi:hypothetical protein